jgi:hypothetical protein
MEVVMIVKYPERTAQDEHGTWWYYWPTQEYANGTRKRVRGRCYVFDCVECGEQVVTHPTRRSTGGNEGRQRYCSRTCAAAGRATNPAWQKYVNRLRETKGSNWQGGRHVIRRGYVHVYKPDHPSGNTSGKYVLEHRLVMEQMLGRYLEKHERVHHKNGDKADNRPENLELWQFGHPPGQRVEEKPHCPTCTCFNH